MIVKGEIKKEELTEPFVKAAVDIAKGAVSIGCELHIDCFDELVRDGSDARQIWGINIYPDKRIDFISLLNIRPDQGNRSMKVEDQKLREKISEIVNKFLA